MQRMDLTIVTKISNGWKKEEGMRRDKGQGTRDKGQGTRDKEGDGRRKKEGEGMRKEKE